MRWLLRFRSILIRSEHAITQLLSERADLLVCLLVLHDTSCLRLISSRLALHSDWFAQLLLDSCRLSSRLDLLTRQLALFAQSAERFADRRSSSLRLMLGIHFGSGLRVLSRRLRLLSVRSHSLARRTIDDHGLLCWRVRLDWSLNGAQAVLRSGIIVCCLLIGISIHRTIRVISSLVAVTRSVARIRIISRFWIRVLRIRTIDLLIALDRFSILALLSI